MTHYQEFNQIPLFHYDLIVVDWAWNFENWSEKGEAKNAKTHYDCIPIDCADEFPITNIAQKDCMIVFWAINPMLPQALELMKLFKVKFVTAGTWIKLTKHEKLAFGTGYILRSANEPFLVGKYGSPNISRSVRSVAAERRDHSRKPDAAYDLFETWMHPDARRIELFSREARQGWDTFDKNPLEFAD